MKTVAGALLVLVGVVTHTTRVAAFPDCTPELVAAFDQHLAGNTVTAGKGLKVVARVRNNGQTPLERVNVKITLPPDWTIKKVVNATAWPVRGLTRKKTIVEDVEGGRKAAYWVDVSLPAYTRRSFVLKAKAPVCSPSATGLDVELMVYMMDSSNTDVTCVTQGAPAQVRGRAHPEILPPRV